MFLLSDNLIRKIKKIDEENKTLRTVLGLIINDLPLSRDWLDPNLENIAKKLLKQEVQHGHDKAARR